MAKCIFITGTDTEVGKTFITAGIGALFLNRGFTVGIMKPVASGALIQNNMPISEDVAFYKHVLNLKDDYNLINPYCFKEPIAPGVAAKREGVMVNLDTIKEKCYKLAKQYDILLIEGAGGLLAPINEKLETNADLIEKLNVPIIIVSKLALGTINHSVLTIEYAKKIKNLSVLGIIFNSANHSQNEIAEKTNPAIINQMSGIKILGVIPRCDFINSICLKSLQDFFVNKIDIS